MRYDSFIYLFPPRPEHRIRWTSLSKYDNSEYFATPKLNGDNVVLFISPDKKWQLWNRHKKPKVRYKDLQFEKLYRGTGWLVLNGEYLDKSKRDADGQIFNHKFIIFDILVYNSEILIGKTYEERMELLEKLYPCQQFRIKESGVEYDPYLCQLDIPDIYKVANFMGGFEDLYKKIIQVDMYEGLVLKRRSAPLEPLFRDGNNSSWQLKVRKPTPNYEF